VLPAVPLSVLDLAPVGEDVSPTDALHASIDLARAADRLGYTRFWVAEHHGMPGIASSAPAVLLAALGARTERIRLGSGGVMLPNHPPLVVAEQFGTLASLHPGRIDLGIGRAPGTDRLTAAALRRSTDPLSADDFPQQLGELLGFLSDRYVAEGLRAVPRAESAPPVWLLGSSGYSAQVAGLLGLPFAFAHHFSAENTVPALELYRRSFRPSETLATPYAMIAVQVLVGDSDAEAEQLALPSALSFLNLRRGRPGRMPTPAQAAAHPWTEAERAAVAARQADQAVGSLATVEGRLSDLLSATGADELMVTTQAYFPHDRVRTLETVRGLVPELPQGWPAAA
jgi:luciferase family oxidoreductase group 1